MQEGSENLEAPKAPEPQQQEPNKVQQIVQEKVADIVNDMPQDDPVIPEQGTAIADQIGAAIDDRMRQFEDKVNAMFIKMGGTVREGGQATPVEPPEPVEQEYVPLDKLDYTI